jgi:hypothetical protein
MSARVLTLISKFEIWTRKKPRDLIGAFSKSLIIKEILAERTGLEPATPGVTGRYSNQLNYHSW